MEASKILTFKQVLVVNLFILLLMISFTASSETYIFNENFESEKLSKKGIDVHGGCYPYSLDIVNAPNMSGKKALKVHLKGWEKNQPCKNWSVGKSRTEMRYGKDTPLHEFAEGEEIWVGWNVLFSKSFPIKDSEYVIVSQFIQDARGPELHFMAGKGKLTIERAWSEKPGGSKKRDHIHAQKIEPNKWINIVVNLKRSRKSDGYIKVWLDGKLVANVKGRNTIMDKGSAKSVGPYFKAGAYFGKEIRRKEYVVYFDEVRIAKGNVGYKTVAVDSKPVPVRPIAPKGLSIQKVAAR